MGEVTSAAQGEEEGVWLIDRLGEEVASILNVSVSGILLYASLTPCIPASGKDRKSEIEMMFRMNEHYKLFLLLLLHLPLITLQVSFTPPLTSLETRESHLSGSLCGIL